MRRIARLVWLGLATFIFFGIVSRALFAQEIRHITENIDDGVSMLYGDNIFIVDTPSPESPDYYYLIGTISGNGANFIKQGQGSLHLYEGDIKARATYTGSITVEEGLLKFVYDDKVQSIGMDKAITVQGASSVLESVTTLVVDPTTTSQNEVNILDGGRLQVGNEGSGDDAHLWFAVSRTTAITVRGIDSSINVGYPDPEPDPDDPNPVLSGLHHLYLAGGGAATMEVLEGASIFIHDDLILGEKVGSTGRLSINGAGSSLFVGRDAYIGYGGSGVLDIFGTATAEIKNDLFIGFQNDSSGLVAVQGAGTTLAVGSRDEDDNPIGGNVALGIGQLYVAEGATLTGETLTVGSGGNATATVTVLGADTKITFGGGSSVGSKTIGTLNISNDSLATFGSNLLLGEEKSVIGRLNVSTGTLSPTSAGLNVAESLVIGHYGNGLALVYGDGLINTAQLLVGRNRIAATEQTPESVADGIVLVSGANTAVHAGVVSPDVLVPPAALGTIIGDSAIGQLIVQNGATFTTNESLIIGNRAGGRGNVLVFGTGSTATIENPAANSGVLIGNAATAGGRAAAVGTLDLRNGGALTNAGVMNVGTIGRGYVRVGNNSTLTSTDTITVGGGTNATSGFLEGRGTIEGDVVLGARGVISAGDYGGQIGTLTINGSLTATTGSILVDYTETTRDVITASEGITVGGGTYIDLTSMHEVATFNALTGVSGSINTDNLRINGSSLVGSRAHNETTGVFNATMTQGGGAISVNIATAVRNLVRTRSAGGLWDITTASDWEQEGTAEVPFFDGDRVVFEADDDAEGALVVDISGIQRVVADMRVNSGNWTFNGSIVADATKTTFTDATGKLVLDNYAGTLTLNGRNSFRGGIDLTGGTPTLILGDGQALGVFEQNTGANQLYNSAGQVVVSGGANATVGIKESQTISNRFVVGRPQVGGTAASPGNLTVDLGGKTLTVVGNTIQGQSGGVFYVARDDSVLNFTSGNLIITNNTANYGNGGGIYYASPDTVDISNLTSIVFSNNAATGGTGYGGGAIYATGTLNISRNGMATFLENVTTGSGGAIRAQDMTFNNSAVFSGNSAGAAGGAVFLSGSNSGTENRIAGGVEFLDNSAVGDGGAVYANLVNLRISGNTLFKENKARFGGALGVNQSSLILDATGGDIIFTGNTATFGIVGASQPNAIDLARSTISMQGSGGIYLDDPISALSTNVDAGTPNRLTVEMESKGFVQFQGDSILNLFPYSSSSSDVTSLGVTGGTMRIVAGASVTDVSNGSFLLSEKGTLAGGGTLYMDLVGLQGVISPDNDTLATPANAEIGGIRTIDATRRIGTLTIGELNENVNGVQVVRTPTVNFRKATLQIDVDANATGQQADLILVQGDVTFYKGNKDDVSTLNTIQVNNWETGIYDIVTATGTLTYDADDIHYNNYFHIVSAEDTLAPARGEAFLLYDEHGLEGTGPTLQLALEDSINLEIYWRGYESVRTWERDSDTKSWEKKTNAESSDQLIRLAFEEGDYVIFDQRAPTQGVITIDSDLEVAGMSITGGTYVFRGGTISSSDPEDVRGKYLDPDERLTVSGGDATFEIATDFAQGVELQGGIVDLKHAQAFGTFKDDPDRKEHRGEVFVTADATIRISDTSQTPVSNRFIVSLERTLAFDFRIHDELAKTFTISGNMEDVRAADALNGGGIELHGDLAFTSLGTLIVENNSVYGKGGGIYSSNHKGTPYDWGVLEFTGLDALTLRGNTAVARTGDTTNENGFGGGLYAAFDATLSGKVRILNNHADYGGGIALGHALAGDDSLSIYTSALNIGGDTLFQGNRANQFGGAIYFSGALENNALNFDTTNGDILFIDNRDSLASAARSNSIYLRQKTDITISGPNSVYFDDPIDVSATDQGGNTLRILGGGIVQFAGNNALNPTGTSGGTVTVESGTLRIVDGGTFATNGDDATFSVLAAPTTTPRAALAGNGTFVAEQGFHIAGTISPDGTFLALTPFSDGEYDLSGQSPPAITDAIGTLNFIGDMTLERATLNFDLSGSSTSDLINVIGNVSFTGKSNVNVNSFGNGVYTLMTASDGFLVDPDRVENVFDLVTLLNQPLGDRMTAKLELINLDAQGYATELVLKLIQEGGSLDLVWKGSEDVNGMIWNMVDVNWRYEDDPNRETAFNAYDYVIFDRTGRQGEITVAGSGVYVSGMDIREGVYTFQGAEDGATIYGVRDPESERAAARQTELLRIGNGDDLSTVITLNIATNFVNGTELAGATVVLGDNRALGSVEQSAQSGRVHVTESSTIKTLEDIVIRNRFDVDAGKALRFNIAEGTSLTIDRINAGNEDGGAISLGHNAMLTMLGSGGTLMISGSSARNGGAIYGSSSGTLNLSPLEQIDLTRNHAATSGGGIYTDSSLLLGANNAFNFNQAQYDGGGIHVSGDLGLGANAVFDGNVANMGDGGAIFAGGNVTIKGSSRFTDNAAGNLGGAIYLSGGTTQEMTTMALDTQDGDILFSGNTHSGGLANAVYTERNTDFRFTGDGNVFFDDPIQVGNSLGTDGGNTLHKSGAGFVQFLGENILNPAGTDGGAVFVNNGALRTVAGNGTRAGSVFATYGDDAAMTVAARGMLAGGGTFVAENGFQIAGTLSADSARILASDEGAGITDADAIGTLNLVGNVALNNATLAVDLAQVGDQYVSDLIAVAGTVSLSGNDNGVDIGRWMNGTFDILLADGGIGDGTTPITDYFTRITVGGNDLGTRQRAVIQLDPDSNGTILQLITDSENLALTWTGAQSMVWNTQDVDWVERNTTNGHTFTALDHVLFDGRGQGTITVDGTSVTNGGMIVSNGNYTFVGGDIIGVAKVFDGRYESDGKLAINAGSVRFDVNTAFEGGIKVADGAVLTVSDTNRMSTDGEFRIERGATLFFDVTDNKFTAGSVRIDGTVEVNQEAEMEPGVQQRYVNVIRAIDADLDQESLSATFNKSIALYGQIAEFTSNRTMDLLYDSITLGQFAEYNHLKGNRESVAYGLDDAFHRGDMLDLEKMMQQFKTNEQVFGVLDLMLGTEMAADALTLAFWKPWNHAFRMVDREYDRGRMRPLTIHRGQGGVYRPSAQRNIWADTYHLDTDVDGDKYANGYGISRTGLNIGADIGITTNNTVGIMFSYGQPWLYSASGKMEMEDYTFSAFIKTHLNWGLEGYGFVGYGHQGYSMRRTVMGERNVAHYDGDTFYIAGKLVRPFAYNRILTFLPTIGLDAQSTSTSTTRESGTLYGQRIQGSDLTSATFNFGLNTLWKVGDWATIDGRLQYARQLADDTYGTVVTTFNASPDAKPMSLRGVDLGRDTFNIGLGGQVFLNCKRSAVLFGDYDYEVGPKAYSQYVRLGLSTMW